MLRKIFVVFLVFMTSSFCASYAEQNEIVPGHDDEIVVKLDTDSNLLPLYLVPFYTENAGFDQQYLRSLERVLRFDFSHNGKTVVVSHSVKKEKQAKKEGFDGSYEIAGWTALDVLYVVKIRIAEKKLAVEAFSVKDDEVKSIKNIPLSGDFNSDRRRVHQLADSVHKAFFACDGIANTRIIYSLKSRNHSDDSYQWTSEICESDYDGGNVHQLTHEGGFCVTPTYLPPKPGFSSGSFFYVSYRMGQPKIFVASLRDGSGRRFSYLRGNQLMPAVGPQRDKVAFICDAAGMADLFLQDYDPRVGIIGKPRQVFSAPRATQASPSFSPDGKKLAFVSNKDGSPRIYILEIPLKGTKGDLINSTLITKLNRENPSPAWSPDGSKIAYSAKTNGVRQVWVYDLETGEEKQLTSERRHHKENPSWAPNSLHIIFNAGDENNSELYLINLNQPKAVKISNGDGEKRFPAWEPRAEA